MVLSLADTPSRCRSRCDHTRLCDRVSRECFKKCIPKIHEADLAIGEMSCIDRCIPKYVEAHMLVQEEFKKNMELATGQATVKQ